MFLGIYLFSSVLSLLVYNCSLQSLMILCVSVLSVVKSPLSFLILLISLFLGNQLKICLFCLSFQRTMSQVSQTISIVFLVSILFISALIFVISFFPLTLALVLLFLPCCFQVFSRCSKRRLLFIVVHGLVIAVVSFVAGYGF